MKVNAAKPTASIRDAVNALLQRNTLTRGREARDMYLGRDILAIRLVETKVIEGQWESIDKTVDIFDLMDDYQGGQP
jgi:hypothetical protein